MIFYLEFLEDFNYKLKKKKLGIVEINVCLKINKIKFLINIFVCF